MVITKHCSHCQHEIEALKMREVFETGRCPFCGVLFNPAQIERMKRRTRALTRFAGWLFLIVGILVSLVALVLLLSREKAAVFVGIVAGLLIYAAGNTLFGWGRSKQDSVLS